MNRSALFATAFGLLALPAAACAASPTLGTYVGGGLAIQDVDGFDDGTAVNLRGAAALPGVLADGVPGALSVEGELTRTLTSPERDLPSGRTVDLDITTLGGYGVYTFPVQRLMLRGRLGLLYEHISANGGDDDNNLELSLGFGAGVMVTQRLEVAASYTYIENDVDHLGANVLYHF
ncbi:MAG TPA: outer membrane beta-barrel protein [Gammaproteobacteria bacterium]|nr:outer membrane beta-barrel protein [Gammaproteobacteria bacterium]